MSRHRKPNFQKILSFLDELKQEAWLGEQRKRWPDFLFHFTDIRNAVSILKHGFLLSRDEAKRQGIDFASSANSRIISRTAPAIKDSVRFYFRPETPTTYRMEGFKPPNKRYEDAHCPVPIYFLFDMREILSLNATRFSDGNLARGEYRLFTTADEFIQLPFRDIYHNTPYNPEDRDRYVNASQAEVIYPRIISLDHLKFIYCRSSAERETLQNLLPTDVWKQWQAKVKVNKKRKLFSKTCLYIEDVTLTKESIDIHFHLPKKREHYGPFKIRVDLTDPRTRRCSYHFQREYSNIVAELTNARFNPSFGKNLSNYDVSVSIDERLAYWGYKRISAAVDLPLPDVKRHYGILKNRAKNKPLANNVSPKRSYFVPAPRKSSAVRRKSRSNVSPKRSNFVPAPRKSSTIKQESESNKISHNPKSDFLDQKETGEAAHPAKKAAESTVAYSAAAYLTKEGEADLRRKLKELEGQYDALTQELKDRNTDHHHRYHMEGRLSLVAGQIGHIQRTLDRATIVEDNGPSDEVRVGSTVVIREDGTNEDEEYKIVGSAEANPSKGKISRKSPIGAALLGKEKGQKVKTRTPDGSVIFEIIDIQ